MADIARSKARDAEVRRAAFHLLAVVPVLLATLATTGCLRGSAADAPNTTTEAITHGRAELRGAATSIDADVRMGVGTLNLVAGGEDATLAFEGSFAYPTSDWKPEVTYDVEANKGRLVVSQPEISVAPKSPLDGSGNTWRLKLMPGLPTRLSLATGVCESDIDLRGVEITWLAVVSGAGKTRIDLSGQRTSSIISRIEPGTGELEIVMPRDVGVRVVGEAVAADRVEAKGFTHTGAAFVNAAWGKPGPKIEMHLLRGGTIRMALAEQ